MNVAITPKELKMILEYREKYKAEVVKDIGVFNPNRWIQFEKTITPNLQKASILHTYNGLELPMKTIHQIKDRDIIEFRGFESYNQKGEDLKEVFKDLQVQLLQGLIQRLDICIDFKYKPYKVLKELEKLRTPFNYGVTTYYKTKKEKKKNNYLDICYYDKKVVHRIEFRFKKSFLKNTTLQEIEKVFSRIEKTISKTTKLAVKIDKSLCCA